MTSLVADLIFRKYKTVEKTAHNYGGGSGADLRCNLVPILEDANTENKCSLYSKAMYKAENNRVANVHLPLQKVPEISSNVPKILKKRLCCTRR